MKGIQTLENLEYANIYLRATSENIVFLFCDLQEKLRGRIPNYDNICQISAFYLEFAKLLNIPFFINIIYPERNGELVKEIDNLLTNEEKKELISVKTSNSMLYDQNCIDFLNKHFERKKVVVFGIETFACIRQTIEDLIRLEKGYEIYLPMDAVGAQKEIEHQSTILQLQNLVNFTTFATLVLEIVGKNLSLEYMQKNPIQFKIHDVLYKERKLFWSQKQKPKL
ncbi:Isochorismatase-like protein [Pseudocohnilembus persalinus]|uniref:Isochorismatase-like protein n=1 Tax=Pseudocohnilembus persalinus TaxID=266149 RepID=A0A0V0QV21_PSEPJ|nr:Isochorismatase-like protein [Pseudocohnilembus persalinus]|eukprot:KRX05949.1 Isochorismatase-like protein [Pseudocohnilembus persalinus]